MSTDTIGPPPEQLARGRWDKPENSRTTQRVAYRRVHPFESLQHQGKISEGCKLAADKLMLHWAGAQGLRTGSDRGMSADDSVEYPQVYHGQKLAEMRAVVGHEPTWQGLIQITEESATLEEIGRQWLGARQRGQAYIAGLAMIRMALDRLAEHYGMCTSFHRRR